MPEDFKAGFLKTLWILKDYLSVIVIGGGWVSFLYYRYLLADKSREPIMTRDIDLLVDINVPMVGEKSVDRLLLEAGFKVDGLVKTIFPSFLDALPREEWLAEG